MKEMEWFQHGDVLVVPGEIPDGVKDTGGNVLAEGEATGHAHRIHGSDYTVFEEPKSKQRYLRVVGSVSLKHEEHKEIKLPPGDYRIGIVREYNHFTEEARRVAD